VVKRIVGAANQRLSTAASNFCRKLAGDQRLATIQAGAEVGVDLAKVMR
jgi:hypothetical protein